MRNGKITENALKRSVLKQIGKRRKEVLCGAGVGTDCAVMSFEEDEETVVSTNPVSASIDIIAMHGVHRALNNIAAAGAEPVGVLLSCLLPENIEESELREMMKQAEEICINCNVQIIGGHTEATQGISKPMLTVTGIGKRKKTDKPRKIEAGQDIVVSKWIGLEGTQMIALKYRDKLLTRYPERMIDEAEEFRQFFSILPEAAAALKSGVCGLHDVSQGGIFGALWEMAQGAGVGLEIDLKKLPIRQETIEICEFFDLNPYELLSGGSLLMTTDDGVGLSENLKRAGVPAVIVGKTTAGNDRVLYNEDEKRFLEPPKADQIYKLQ
ncbi:MAG: AIR synthase family protein [Clostridiales bacterium]|nr:AIR synthase family protein [Clostridiales bacterium]